MMSRTRDDRTMGPGLPNTGMNRLPGCALSRLRGAAWLMITLMAAMAGIGWADSWEAIRSAARGISTVQSPFTQEKHLRMLAGPLISKGRLVFRRPGSLRWEYLAPIPSVLLMHGGAMHRFQEIDGRWIEDTAGGVSAMPVVAEEITRWLNGQFEGNPYFTAALAPGSRVTLTPKDPSMARIISQIVLELGDRPGIITAVTIHESPTSYTRILFDSPLINAPVDDALFTEVP
ncbi:MAG: outer membrane lipoprotein carrier protein LolA [Pseudomonadota bacterium]